MPLYVYCENAVNTVRVSDKARESAAMGTAAVLQKIADIGKGGAIDGWYGVNGKSIAEPLKNCYDKQGIPVEMVHAYTLYQNAEKISAYQKTCEMEVPSFGWVNSDGVLLDILDEDKLAALRTHATENTAAGKATVVWPRRCHSPCSGCLYRCLLCRFHHAAHAVEIV